MEKSGNGCKTEPIDNSFEKEYINMNLYRNFIDDVDHVSGRDSDNLTPNTTHEE